MRIAKYFLFLLLTVCCLNTSFAQKANKVEQMAMEKTEKINEQIIAGDPDKALTDAQKKEVTAVYVQLTKEVRALKKSEASAEEQKEQAKELRKAANKKINQEILTKDQRAAKRAGKE